MTATPLELTILMPCLNEAILMIPTIVNGYPFVFPDTGTYLRQAIELYGTPDRPPYYSLLIYPFHLKLTLWPVAVVQAAAAAAAIRLAFHAIDPTVGTARDLLVVGALAALTSLPWHTGQVVPDGFSGILVLVVFALCFAAPPLAPAGRWLLATVVAAMIGLHLSHLPLAACLFAAAALIRGAQGRGLREVARIMAMGACAVALGAAAFLAYGLALTGRPVLSPHGSVFMMARMLADGPARDYLVATCPSSANPFCRYLDRLSNDPNAFLWNDDSPLALVTRELGDDATRRAAAEIVAGVIATRPAEQLAAIAANAARQLARFGTLDTLCPDQCGDGSAVDHAIRRHFAAEHDAFRASLQMRGRLPVAPIRVVHGTVVVAAALTTILLLVVAVRARAQRLVGLIALVWTALVANAAIAGALSGPYDRYQSRVVWLLPLAALLAIRRPGGSSAHE